MIEIVNNDTIRVTVTNPPPINVIVSTTQTIPVVVGIQGPSGPPGPPGPSIGSITQIAGETLSGHRVVMIADDGKVYYADRTVSGHIHRVLGITAHAVVAGEEVIIHTYGRIDEPSWNWTVGNQVYLDTNGYMTQTVPTSGFLLKIGFPLSATSLFIDIDTPIVLA